MEGRMEVGRIREDAFKVFSPDHHKLNRKLALGYSAVRVVDGRENARTYERDANSGKSTRSWDRDAIELDLGVWEQPDF